MTFLARSTDPFQARNALAIGLSVFTYLAVIVDARRISAGIVPPFGSITGVGLWLVFFLLIVIEGRNAMSEEN